MARKSSICSMVIISLLVITVTTASSKSKDKSEDKVSGKVLTSNITPSKDEILAMQQSAQSGPQSSGKMWSTRLFCEIQYPGQIQNWKVDCENATHLSGRIADCCTHGDHWGLAIRNCPNTSCCVPGDYWGQAIRNCPHTAVTASPEPVLPGPGIGTYGIAASVYDYGGNDKPGHMNSDIDCSYLHGNDIFSAGAWITLESDGICTVSSSATIESKFTIPTEKGQGSMNVNTHCEMEKTTAVSTTKAQTTKAQATKAQATKSTTKKKQAEKSPATTKKSQVFSAAADNQPAVSVNGLQDERKMPAYNKIIGRFELNDILPKPCGESQVVVTFYLDADGLLHVSAKDMSTGKERDIHINASSGLNEQEVERIMEETRKQRQKSTKP